jgi:hypothetical protein
MPILFSLYLHSFMRASPRSLSSLTSLDEGPGPTASSRLLASDGGETDRSAVLNCQFDARISLQLRAVREMIGVS